MKKEDNNKNSRHGSLAEQKQTEMRLQIEKSKPYKLVRSDAIVMDRYFIDPLIGLIPGGVGDIIGALVSLPCLYVSIRIIKSVPLTLAIIHNIIRDILLGMIPLWIGNIIDFLWKANSRNYRLVEGFIDGDKGIIREVNRKAAWTAASIVILVLLIILMIWLLITLASEIGRLFT